MVGICLPSFVIGPLLAVTAGLGLKSLNVAGWASPSDWILPAFTLGIINAAYLARLARGGMLDVLSQDYIRTARAKGAPPSRIVIRHALRGGLIPAGAFIDSAFVFNFMDLFAGIALLVVHGCHRHCCLRVIYAQNIFRAHSKIV